MGLCIESIIHPANRVPRPDVLGILNKENSALDVKSASRGVRKKRRSSNKTIQRRVHKNIIMDVKIVSIVCSEVCISIHTSGKWRLDVGITGVCRGWTPRINHNYSRAATGRTGRGIGAVRNSKTIRPYYCYYFISPINSYTPYSGSPTKVQGRTDRQPVAYHSYSYCWRSAYRSKRIGSERCCYLKVRA